MKKLWLSIMRILALSLGVFTFTACYSPAPGYGQWEEIADETTDDMTKSVESESTYECEKL